MTSNGWIQILFFFASVFLLARPMGVYMVKVFERQKTPLDPILRPIERLLYKLTLVEEAQEMRWTEYAVAMLLFSAATLLLTYAVERLQYYLPWRLR